MTEICVCFSDYTFPPVQNAKIYEMENSSFSVWNNEPNRFAIDEEELKRYEGRRQSSDKIRKQSKKTKSLATVKK
jgi:hypothetical protein